MSGKISRNLLKLIGLKKWLIKINFAITHITQGQNSTLVHKASTNVFPNIKLEAYINHYIIATNYLFVNIKLSHHLLRFP